MRQKIWYMVSNNGDGSGDAHFYKDGPGIGEYLDQMIENDPETWGGNDGGPNFFEIEGEIVDSSYGVNNFFSEPEEVEADEDE